MLRNLTVEIYGESHGESVGCKISGLPEGVLIDGQAIAFHLKRRAPGGRLSTPRKEADKPLFLSGVENDRATGGELHAQILNTNVKSRDYGKLAGIPRPGHADLAAMKKYGPGVNLVGGGRFSGRLTAPLVIAGSICRRELEKEGCYIAAKMIQAGGAGAPDFPEGLTKEHIMAAWQEEPAPEIAAEIERASLEKDSLGAKVALAALVPAGLGGEDFFSGAESFLAALLYSVPGVKGVGFGAYESAPSARGSRYNDPIFCENGEIKTRTNHAGGINGGITNGMPLRIYCHMRPTPSIFLPQESVDFATGRQAEICIEGRHDPCIAVRALPALESAAAIALYDMLLETKKKGGANYGRH